MNNTKLGILIFGVGIFLVTTMLVGCPFYNVYTQRMQGKAEFERANYNRMIKVTEANATYDASQKLAQADTVRAHGIAKSNEIIGRSLKQNPMYLQWLWIEQLKENKNNQIIYVPSGNLGMPNALPATEAARTVVTGLTKAGAPILSFEKDDQ